MILNPGECILCKNQSEARQLGKMLHEDGYRMFSPKFSILSSDAKNYHGYRWFNGHEYPTCIVATSYDQKRHILEGHRVQDVQYTYLWFDDFIEKIKGSSVSIEVGDLL